MQTYSYYIDIAHFIGVRIIKQKIINNDRNRRII